MTHSTLLAAATLCLAAACRTAPSPPPLFEFTDDPERGALELTERGVPVLTYRYGDQLPEGVTPDRLRSSYVHPIWGLDGEVLTDDFPADHLHHRGLSLMWPRMKVGGEAVELWHIHGIRQLFDRWLERSVDDAGAHLRVANDWTLTDGTVVAHEVVAYHVHPSTERGRAIDVEYRISVLDQAITLQGAEGKGYGGLNLRFAPRVDTELHTEAGRLEKDSDRERHRWTDLSARFGGRESFSGIAILVAREHPDFPPPWTLRYYGDLNVAWPGVEATELEPQSVVKLDYRLWVHRGDAIGGGVLEQWKEYSADE